MTITITLLLLGASLLYLAYAFLSGEAYEDVEIEDEEIEFVDEETPAQNVVLLEAYHKQIEPLKNYVVYLKGAYQSGIINEEEYIREMTVCTEKLQSFIDEYGIREEEETNV